MRRKRRRAAALQAQTFIFDRIVSRSFAKLSSSKFYSEEKFLVRKRVRSTTKASHAFHTSSLSALYLEDGPAFDQRVILFNSTEATNEEFLSFESKIANVKLNRSFRVGILVQVERGNHVCYSPFKIIRTYISSLSNTWTSITR